jgi:hypothetical protein
MHLTQEKPLFKKKQYWIILNSFRILNSRYGKIDYVIICDDQVKGISLA